MNSTARFKVGWVLLAVSIGALPYLAAQTLWGDWFIVMTTVFPDQATCQYSGEAQTDQNGTQVTGKVVQYLSSGPADRCPAAMNADIEGTLDGTTLTGRLNGGQLFGFASFSGTVGASSASGTFMTEDASQMLAARAQSPAGAAGGGPFPGVQGTWQAQTDLPLDIPVLGFFGLALLVGVFLLVGPYLLRSGASA